MPKPNIVYLPGIFGSLLGAPGLLPGGSYVVWITPFTALTGILLQLELAADGISPGPHTWGVPMGPVGLYAPAYGELAGYMTGRGWNVLTVPYDWRLSVLVSAKAVLAAVQAAFGQQPFIFVAHSMGGLVARAVYAYLVTAGLGQQVAGLVQLATPNFGSWEVQRGFFGLPDTYQLLKKAAGIIGPLNPFSRVDFLDLCLASWPGFYELCPWRDMGPLATNFPAVAQSLYSLATYAGGNPYVSQTWLNAAVQTQHTLQSAIPFGLVRTITGRGFYTADMTNPPNPLSTPAGYAYTGFGDGEVPADYAMLPGQPDTGVQFYHGDMPRTPKVWDAVTWSVQSLVGPGA